MDLVGIDPHRPLRWQLVGGKVNSGEPPDQSNNRHPPRSTAAGPLFRTCTYSSDSVLRTRPSKKTHSITNPSPSAEEGVTVGVGCSVGVGTQVKLEARSVGTLAAGAGVGLSTETGASVGSGVAVPSIMVKLETDVGAGTAVDGRGWRCRRL